MEVEKEANAHESVKSAPQKKSKRKYFALLALVIAVLIYFLVPSGAPTSEAEVSDLASTEATISVGKVKIESYEAKKKLFGKWQITGVLSNSSDAPIESIEFELVFSDNTEFVLYDEFIKAGETDHEFELKVTGHKGENLNELKIREVQKAR